MQATWSHEPPDQRFFRLYNLEVETVDSETVGVQLQMAAIEAAIADLMQGFSGMRASLPVPHFGFATKQLVEIADLDTVLDYKGNYSIFALKENNYVTLHQMQDYLDVSDE